MAEPSRDGGTPPPGAPRGRPPAEPATPELLEAGAIAQIAKALAPLDEPGRRRALAWACNRYQYTPPIDG